MKKILRIIIEELDYYVETEWKYDEFPKVGDFISVLNFCSDDDVKYFTDSPLPEYLHSDFDNILEYVKYYRWQVVEAKRERGCELHKRHSLEPNRDIYIKRTGQALSLQRYLNHN